MQIRGVCRPGRIASGSSSHGSAPVLPPLNAWYGWQPRASDSSRILATSPGDKKYGPRESGPTMMGLSRHGLRRRPRTALVLGSGGIRTVCHIGLFKALRREGIPIDMVVGSSGGSLFGAAFALGTDP